MKLDEVGVWSEIKLAILNEYASAYTRLLKAKTWCRGLTYVDAFAGAGIHVSKATGKMIPGSPLNALYVQPPFDRIVLIDVDSRKVESLHEICGSDSRVEVKTGDCNEVLLSVVLPTLQYESYRRALCVLDPYGIHGKTLRWPTIQRIAQARTFDMFLNFPLMDINRNTLRKHLDSVAMPDIVAFTEFWGGEDWKSRMYQTDLFGELGKVGTNRSLAIAFRERLCDVARFEFVPEPILMRNTKGGELYYLFFASHQPVAQEIVGDIFNKYRSRT
ncbi:MAG: three-Cys-motif partner protein TcmP [Candidatus Eisenbacteria bacterium]